MRRSTHTPRVWITGGGGLVGQYLLRAAPMVCPEWRITAPIRARLDLTDLASVRRGFSEADPDLVIHCAALSRGHACETNPKLAQLLNVELTRELTGLAAGIPLIGFSTDLVFDGKQGNYVETDAPNPLSVYAATKLQGDEIVLRNPRHTIVRMSLICGVSREGDRSFTEQMRLAWSRGETLRLFTDEFRCPLHASVAARAVWELARAGRTGLFHLAGNKRLSRWEIGEMVAARSPGLDTRMQRASIQDYSGPPRSPDTSMNCSKIQAVLSFPLPGLNDWVRNHPNEPL